MIHLDNFLRKSGLLSLGAIFSLAYSLALSAPATEVSLNVRAELRDAFSDHPKLELTLSNPNNVPLSLYSSSLPWGTRRSLILVAVMNDSAATRIDELLYVDDPGPGRVAVNPGEKKIGLIDLAARFPGLAAIRSKGDVIIFWSYRPALLSEGKARRVSGSVELPKLP